MVEPGAADEARIAEAVARLLARQAELLARAAEDEAAAGGARLGLSWLVELLRSFNLAGASGWFQTLRTLEGPGGGRTSAAWPLVGAPLCEALAEEVRRAGTLASLAGEGWSARVAELQAFVEPLPLPAPAPESRSAHEAAEEEPVGEEAAPPVEPQPALADVDDSHAALFEAIADFAGAARPEVDARHGRVEIAGSRTLPAGGMDAASDVLLRALDRAAREAGAVLLAETQGGALSWRVRLPRPEARHYLFVERSQTSFAVPWSRVVEYGLTSGGERLRVVLGSGLERIELPVTWLFGKGEGTPAPAELGGPPVDVPERFRLGGWVADADGGIARVLDLEAEAPVEPTEPAPDPTFEEPDPAAGPAPALETVQPAALPADNHPEAGRVFTRVTRALVADDSMMARVFLGRLLAQRGIEVDEAEDGVQAQAALMARTFDLVFLDADMPGMGAGEILDAGGAELAARVCVLVKDDEERRRAEVFGAGPILYKPFAEDEVRSAVDALLARVPSGN